MARKQRTPPGFIGLRTNYEAALSEYMAAVMMLEQWARLAVKEGELPETLRTSGVQYLADLDAAKYRDGD